MSSYDKDKAKILARLKRIEGQIRGLQRMVLEDKYCVDILTQISSVIGATEKVGLVILRDHVEGCVWDATEREDVEVKVTELINIVERFIKV